MRSIAALLRRRPIVVSKARSGQIVVLFALSLTVLLGMAALGVDLGHAIERHQFIQGAANNTARAGAFEAYTQAVPTGSQSDAAVVNSMVDTLQQSGLSVANYDPVTNQLASFTSLASHGSACPGHLGPTQVYLEAQYIDANGTQIGRVGRGTPASVPTSTKGVQVTHLALCVPSFFSGVLGRKSFDVGAGDQAGTAQFVDAFGQLPTSPALTSVKEYYVYGHQCQPPDPACPSVPYTLFAANAPDGPVAATPPDFQSTTAGFSCPDPSHIIPCSGDLVTMYNPNNGGGLVNTEWDYHQFLTTAEGTSNNTINPITGNGGFPVHDGSNRGCLDPSFSTFTFDQWSYNQGGDGHCLTPAPTPGSTVEIPVVDSVCKNGGYGHVSGPGPTPDCAPDPSVQEGAGGTNGSTCAHGGWCVHVVGFVVVYVATNNGGPGGNLTQGYITKVLQDPYCIVETKKGEHPDVPSGFPYHTDGCPYLS